MLADSNLLTLPDYIVIVIYLVCTIGLGIVIGSRLKSGKDFFLGGRSLPWWAIGMSLVATDIGGTDIVGVGGLAYSHGLAVANFEWIGCVPAMIVGAFVFILFSIGPASTPSPSSWNDATTQVFDWRLQPVGYFSWPATLALCCSPRPK